MAAKVLKDYEASLEDLTFNSKPIINMLTMEADKHATCADDIVQLIEARFFKVASPSIGCFSWSIALCP